jgi:hypothetical protein
MKIAKALALGVVCVLAAATAQAQAQPKQFVNVLTIHTKPEGALDYEAFVKKVIAAGDKIGQTQRTITYQVTTGGPGYTYMIATYFDKWSETDEILSTPEILFKALGDLEGGRALRAGRVNIESFDTAVYHLVPDLSTKPKVFDPPTAYLQMIRTYVKPEMIQEWEHLIGRYKAASEQVAEAPTAIRRSSVEGPMNVYITSSSYNKAAERDAWPSFQDVLKKAYGEEEARAMNARRGACTERSEALILKFRPDLSRLGK